MNHKRFESQLENLRRESNVVACYVYAELAINYRAGKSRRLLQRLNETPTFWKVVASALQTSAYISLSRVFDDKAKFTLEGLLRAFERDIGAFQRDALRVRKWNGTGEKPEWLDGYLDEAYYPTLKDVERVRAKVGRFRQLYESAIKDARNQYLAHRQEADHVAVAELFGKGEITEICRLSIFLLDLHDALNELYVNGRIPRFPPIRTSLDMLFHSLSRKQKSGASWRSHERIAADVNKLMRVLESIPFTVR